MGFFEPSVMGVAGGGGAPHRTFVVIAPMMMKFDNTMVSKTSTQW